MLHGIGVGRIRTSPFLPFSFDSVAYDPGKTRMSASKAEAEEPTNHDAWNREHCHCFILQLQIIIAINTAIRTKKNNNFGRCIGTISTLIVSITKFSLVIGSPRDYLSRNRRAIT